MSDQIIFFFGLAITTLCAIFLITTIIGMKGLKSGPEPEKK